MKFDSTEYKQKNIKLWNEIAPRYHRRLASMADGPFQSTAKLVDMLSVSKGNTILDIACGTGAVTKEIGDRLGDSGYVVGVDTSAVAIKIAKKMNKKRRRRGRNLNFVNMDAEKFSFSKKFDVITCQYALFFFPNAQKALKNMRRSLKKSGRIGFSVHGKENVPFFTNILDSVTKFIPDYIPPGSPNLDRFGTKTSLRKEIHKAGFSGISVKEFVFHYSPGKFEDYWRNYLRYLATPLKEKINGLEYSKRKKLKEMVKAKTAQYVQDDDCGNIEFPWQVLILTARY